jgi:hypothetical protein
MESPIDEMLRTVAETTVWQWREMRREIAEHGSISLAQIRRITRGISRRRKAKELSAPTDFLSITDLAQRWRCSRGTVMSVLRRCHAKMLDLAPHGKRGRKVIALATVREIEKRIERGVR